MDDKVSKGRQSRGDAHYSRTNPEKLARGERNGMAKLSDWQRFDIRANYALCRVSQRELARRHSVSQHTIWQIVKGIQK
jgi:DNA-binding XRE family transcriptional regulator